jgi:hypothetical protein
MVMKAKVQGESTFGTAHSNRATSQDAETASETKTPRRREREFGTDTFRG